MIIHTEKLLIAADIMTLNPQSLRSGSTIKDAAAFLLDRGFSAAPVVNDAGRAVGVVSLSDIVRKQCEKVSYVEREVYQSASRKLPGGERIGEGFQVEETPDSTVNDIMTPAVFSVKAGAPVQEVIDQMLKQKVHRLYVCDETGTLVGVITSMDLIRSLKSAYA